MRGIILAGGFGTRLRDFTKRLNKGMAPIYTKTGATPQIFYPLRTLINSGITEIMIITSRDHCGQMVELLGDGSEYGCSLTYRIQEMNRPVVGIAQALGLAKNFVENQNAFAVVLGDNFYEESFAEAFAAFEKESSNGVSFKRIPIVGYRRKKHNGLATWEALYFLKKPTISIRVLISQLVYYFFKAGTALVENSGCL